MCRFRSDPLSAANQIHFPISSPSAPGRRPSPAIRRTSRRTKDCVAALQWDLSSPPKVDPDPGPAPKLAVGAPTETARGRSCVRWSRLVRPFGPRAARLAAAFSRGRGRSRSARSGPLRQGTAPATKLESPCRATRRRLVRASRRLASRREARGFEGRSTPFSPPRHRLRPSKLSIPRVEPRSFRSSSKPLRACSPLLLASQARLSRRVGGASRRCSARRNGC